MKGVYVSSVSEGSAAAEAGLQKGDVVTIVDGKEVAKMAELQEVLSKHRPGDKVNIKYVRNKKTQSASVTLRNSQGNTTVLKEVDVDDFGVQLVPVTEKDKQTYGVQYGLMVNNIKRGKMQEAGMSKGMVILMVNDQRMNTLEDWENVVKNTNKSSDRTLWIRAITSSGRKASFVVELGD